MWCASRASPVSTTRPTRVRVFSRIRWWWTAPVSSSDGIGARPVGAAAVGQHDEPRAASIAASTSAQISSSRCAQASPPPARSNRPSTTCAAKPGQVALVVDVHDLGQVLLPITGNGSTIWRQEAGLGLEQVPLGADVGAERGDELLADRVQRRVGDLREQLGEVVEHQPRPVRQHGHGGVGAHRADRLGARPRHRRQDDAQLLFGVAEGLLAGQQVRRGRHDVRSRSGSSSRWTSPACSQSAYGCSAASSALISSSSMIRPAAGVDQEDPAGLQPALAHHAARARCRARRPRRPARPGRRLVTQYRPGRRPLRSSTAPITVPSVKAISAGPSHGSISVEWNW